MFEVVDLALLSFCLSSDAGKDPGMTVFEKYDFFIPFWAVQAEPLAVSVPYGKKVIQFQ